MLRKRALTVAFCLLVVSVTTLSADEPALDTEDKKTLYAIGIAMSRQLSNFGLSADDLTMIERGLEDGLLGRDSEVDLEGYGQRIEQFLSSRLDAQTDREKEAGQQFRDKMAQQPDAVITDSGLIYFEIEPGTGQAPTATDTVRVNYHGTFADGRVFDSSRESGEPAVFGLGGVVPCFAEGIQRMQVGGKAKLVCAPELAYGDQGFPPLVPPGATLVFELELLELVSQAPPPAPPSP